MRAARIVATVLLLGAGRAVALQPLDLTLALAGSALTGGGLLVANRVPPVTEEQRLQLRIEDLPPMDRALVFPDQPLIGGISDMVAYSQVLVPVGAAAFGLERRDAQDVLARHYQVLAITYGSSYLIKAAVWRARPFLYDPNVSPERAADRTGGNSFPSSHVAVAFASATFISTIADQYWDERYTTILTVGSYATASMAAILRIAAGRHFVSDVLAGALLGIAVGWAVPTAHLLSSR